MYFTKHIYTYDSLKDDTILGFNDILNIVDHINTIRRQSNVGNKKGKIEFYLKLGESILRGINSTYCIAKYVDGDFNLGEKNTTHLAMLNIRESYVNVIQTFSSYHVGYPWRYLSLFSNSEKWLDEVEYFSSVSGELEEHIINISNLIGKDLGEDVEKYISFGDLQAYYGFDLDMNEIQEKYFRL